MRRGPREEGRAGGRGQAGERDVKGIKMYVYQLPMMNVIMFCKCVLIKIKKKILKLNLCPFSTCHVVN